MRVRKDPWSETKIAEEIGNGDVTKAEGEETREGKGEELSDQIYLYSIMFLDYVNKKPYL